ncbi:hypothetical protein SAMN05660916_02383 [Arthrobacter sp. 31Cvi3.1E]|nr:hypothetical protein SAMN05660916_02383 [Arthrobacter sp. 31Cvi3.1E]
MLGRALVGSQPKRQPRPLMSLSSPKGHSVGENSAFL